VGWAGLGGGGKGRTAAPHAYMLRACAAGLSRTLTLARRQGINQLGENAKSGALEDAKRSFVTSVSALQSWAETAGIAGELKGL